MNIKEVAELAGVSVATVSRAINNSSVTPETRNKILQVIEETGYIPNLTGRNLRKSKSNKLLAIVPDISNDFYAEILRGIKDVSDSFDYNLLFVTTNFNEFAERDALELLSTKQIDGVISFFSSLPQEDVKTITSKFPYVQCCEATDGVLLTKVTIDNLQAGYDATSYFLKKGHRNIAMISGQLYPMACRNREAGFKRALLESDIDPKNRKIELGDFSYRGGYEACKKLFSSENPPTALFAASDSMAIGAIRFLQDHGVKIPDDVEVIGFDNNEIAEFNNPPLSTVAQPRFEMGRMAAELLMKKIEDKNAIPASVILPHELIFRASTGKQDEKK